MSEDWLDAVEISVNISVCKKVGVWFLHRTIRRRCLALDRCVTSTDLGTQGLRVLDVCVLHSGTPDVENLLIFARRIWRKMGLERRWILSWDEVGFKVRIVDYEVKLKFW